MEGKKDAPEGNEGKEVPVQPVDNSNEESGEEVEMVDIEDLEKLPELLKQLNLPPETKLSKQPQSDEEWESIDEEEEEENSHDTFESSARPAECPILAGVFAGHAKGIVSLAVHPTKPDFFATGSIDDSLGLWNVTEEGPIKKLEFGDTVSLVEFNHDGSLLNVATMENEVRILKICEEEGLAPLRTIKTFEGEVNSMRAHAKGNFVLIGTSEGELQLLNSETGQAREFFGHSAGINQVEFTPDGKLVLSASEDASIKYWQVSSGNCLSTLSGRKFHQAAVLSFSCHANKPLVASGSADSTWAISNFENGETYFRSQELPDSETAICATCIASPLEALTIGDLDGNLSMFDMTKQIKLAEFKAKKSIVNVKFWEKQRLFVTSTASGEILLNGFGGRQAHVINKICKKAINDFRIVGEHQILAASEDAKIYLLDIRKLGANY